MVPQALRGTTDLLSDEITRWLVNSTERAQWVRQATGERAERWIEQGIQDGESHAEGSCGTRPRG